MVRPSCHFALAVSLAVATGCAPAMPGPGALDADLGIDAAAFDASRGPDALVVDATSSDASALDAADAVTAPDAPRGDGGPPPACPPGGGCTLPDGRVGACCDGACVDASFDPENCDRCGLRCGAGWICVGGVCAEPSCASPTPYAGFAACPLADGVSIGICCGGTCHAFSDFDADGANCGGCDFECLAGASCSGGHCGSPRCGPAGAPACPAGTTCDASGACIPSGCAGAADGTNCALSVYPYRGACCAGGCVDPWTDAANCGSCGNACATGTVCDRGACSPLSACDRPGTAAASCVLASGAVGRCCDGACTDPASDDTNCHVCSNACFGGASCTSVPSRTRDGACVLATDGGLTTPHCATDADCPATTQCDPRSSACVRLDCAGRPDGTSCRTSSAGDGLCCGGACVDPTRDPNCGACGVSCDSGVCALISGVPFVPIVACLPATTTSPDCSGAGGCAATEACVGGVCVARSCASGGPFRMTEDRRRSFCLAASGAAGLCLDDFGTGTLVCVDVANDPMHCGGFGPGCAAGERCERGTCVP